MKAYFGNIPKDLIIIIYKFTPQSWPMLRKVNRRWREALAFAIDAHDTEYYIERAAIDGPTVYLGKITSTDIVNHAICYRFTTLIYAKYKWSCDKCDNHLLLNLRSICECDPVGAQKSEARDLLRALIQKYDYVTGDNRIINMVILLDDIELLETAQQCGYSFKEEFMDTAPSYQIMKKLHEFGCIGSHELLLNCMKKMTRCMGVDLDDNYLKMLEFAFSIGCKIRVEDVKYALDWCIKPAIKLMYDAGLIIPEKMLENRSRQVVEFVEGLTCKRAHKLLDNKRKK